MALGPGRTGGGRQQAAPGPGRRGRLRAQLAVPVQRPRRGPRPPRLSRYQEGRRRHLVPGVGRGRAPRSLGAPTLRSPERGGRRRPRRPRSPRWSSRLGRGQGGRAAPREGKGRVARPARLQVPASARAADGRAARDRREMSPSSSNPTSRRAMADCATSSSCAPSRPSRRCWPSTPIWPRSTARPHCSPTSGSSSTASPGASTTSSCSRTRTRWPTRWASRTRTRSCWPSRRPAARSPGSATTCGAGGGSGTRPHPPGAASAAARRTHATRPALGDLGPDMVEVDGEIALTPLAPVSDDTSLPLRLAATAAGLDRPIARGSLHRLADRMPPPSDPWTDETREALVALLGLGRPAVDKIESLDQHGLLVRLIPEWSAVRNKPQRNAYHTLHRRPAPPGGRGARRRVDRSGRTAGSAPGRHASPRHRQGLPRRPHRRRHGGRRAHHARAWGSRPADVDILVALVRHHLLLPDAATRRDLDDPTTITRVARAVGNRLTLHLLAALTEADSRATGPSAWGDWKAGLVADLVRARGPRAPR